MATFLTADVSNAVPICNSLAFVFTAITSRLLGEQPQRPICTWPQPPSHSNHSNTHYSIFSLTAATYTGMTLILTGVAICFDSKQNAA